MARSTDYERQQRYQHNPYRYVTVSLAPSTAPPELETGQGHNFVNFLENVIKSS